MTESSAGMNKIEVGHQMYRDGRYEEALGFYTEALSVAKTKPQKIALHSNRAACFLKLHLFKKAAEECTAVLELNQNHTGALMLRAQTLVTLKEYHSALFDVNRLMELNPLSEVYRNLETRLRTQLSLAPIPETDEEFEEEEEDEKENEDVEAFQREDEKQDCAATSELENNQKMESHVTSLDVIVSKALKVKESTEREGVPRVEPRKTVAAEVIAQVQRKPEVVAQAQQKVEPRKSIALEVIAHARKTKESPNQNSKAWETIPKPKGHSTLDYARWDKVEDDSSEDEDEDDEEESQPQYRFRLKTVGVQSVK